MAWKQTRGFDPNKGGKTAGYCLQNVRLGYGIAAVHPDAWTAWKNTQQHTEAIPNGVAVPLFYDYTDKKGNRYGHINVRLPDGRIWNDGRYYQNIDTFRASMSSVRYVGWGESVNGVRVINWVADPQPPKGDTEVANANQVNNIYKAVLFREGDAGGIKNYTGRNANDIIAEMLGSKERKNVEAHYNKPPVVVEKIKEVPVEKEVIKEVPVPVDRVVEKKIVVDPTYYNIPTLVRAIFRKIRHRDFK